jgi:glycosyltransferase involved in cell wall biosynthesis
MGKKVSIITRAFNRLEYTIQCIDSVKKNTGYSDYEHIIVNNNSSDGTKEWLGWVIESGLPYFNKVRALHYKENLGDWGGMVDAIKYVSEDSEYYVQLDNDLIIDDKEWLNKMIHILENTKYRIAQLKRIGVKTVVTPTNIETIKYNENELRFGEIVRPVGCFIVRTADFKRLYDELKNTGFMNHNDGKSILSNKLGGVGKLINVKCFMLDGYDGKTYLNYEKYPPKLKINNNNVIHEMK